MKSTQVQEWVRCHSQLCEKHCTSLSSQQVYLSLSHNGHIYYPKYKKGIKEEMKLRLANTTTLNSKNSKQSSSYTFNLHCSLLICLFRSKLIVNTNLYSNDCFYSSRDQFGQILEKTRRVNPSG